MITWATYFKFYLYRSDLVDYPVPPQIAGPPAAPAFINIDSPYQFSIGHPLFVDASPSPLLALHNQLSIYENTHLSLVFMLEEYLKKKEIRK